MSRGTGQREPRLPGELQLPVVEGKVGAIEDKPGSQRGHSLQAARLHLASTGTCSPDTHLSRPGSWSPPLVPKDVGAGTPQKPAVYYVHEGPGRLLGWSHHLYPWGKGRGTGSPMKGKAQCEGPFHPCCPKPGHPTQEMVLGWGSSAARHMGAPPAASDLTRL